MINRLAVFTAATFLVFVMGRPVTAAAQTGLPEPCSLVTPAEVAAAMGKGATITRYHNPRVGMDECKLKGGASGLREVIIVVHRVEQWEATKRMLMSGDKTIRQVHGLGDDAFAGRMIGYNVKKGNRYVQVFGEVTNKDAANEKATRLLAEKAAARL